jgi:hypothetical protein
MRRILAAMGAAPVISSGVALAVTKQCKTDVPCSGANQHDKLPSTEAFNEMYALGRADTLKGFAYYDDMYG